MATECYSQLGFGFQPKLIVDFAGGTLTTDAGLLLVREFDEQFRLSADVVNRIVDTRDARYITHDLHALVRQRLARSWIELELFRWHNARTLERLARGDEIGAMSSVVKLHWANMSQRLYETAVSVLAPDVPEQWTLGLLATRANSIKGGTSEIQKNIIGERLLGLPR